MAPPTAMNLRTHFQQRESNYEHFYHLEMIQIQISCQTRYCICWECDGTHKCCKARKDERKQSIRTYWGLLLLLLLLLLASSAVEDAVHVINSVLCDLCWTSVTVSIENNLWCLWSFPFLIWASSTKVTTWPTHQRPSLVFLSSSLLILIWLYYTPCNPESRKGPICNPDVHPHGFPEGSHCSAWTWDTCRDTQETHRDTQDTSRGSHFSDHCLVSHVSHLCVLFRTDTLQDNCFLVKRGYSRWSLLLEIQGWTLPQTPLKTFLHITLRLVLNNKSFHILHNPHNVP